MIVAQEDDARMATGKTFDQSQRGEPADLGRSGEVTRVSTVATTPA